MRGPLRAAADRWRGRGRGLQPWRRQPAPARGGVAARESPRRSPSTPPSPSATRRWRCSATSLRPGRHRRPARDARAARRAGAPSASAATCTRSSTTSAATPARWSPPRAGTPATRCCSSIAVPTIAFAGVTTVPQESWPIVERCAPAYGDDWWYTGLLAFMRQEQRRCDEAMDPVLPLARGRAGAGPLGARPGPRALRDRRPRGRAGLDGRVDPGVGQSSTTSATSPGTPRCTSCPWATSPRSGTATPRSCAPTLVGCRALVDSGSLLWRWAMTPGAVDVPGMDAVARGDRGRPCSQRRRPRSWRCTPPWRCCASVDADGLATTGALAGQPGTTTRRTPRWSPRWPRALRGLVPGDPSTAADRARRRCSRGSGGSAAATPSARSSRTPCSRALLRAGRFAEARPLVDQRPRPPALPPRRVVPDPGSADRDLAAQTRRPSSTPTGPERDRRPGSPRP